MKEIQAEMDEILLKRTKDTEYGKLNEENLQPPRASKKWYHRTVKDIMNREGIS